MRTLELEVKYSIGPLLYQHKYEPENYWVNFTIINMLCKYDKLVSFAPASGLFFFKKKYNPFSFTTTVAAHLTIITCCYLFHYSSGMGQLSLRESCT